MMNFSGSSITVSSRLPETYHMITLSPARICLPSKSMSLSAVRRMWASGVCQRMISGTMFGISERSAFSLSYWSGY